MSHLGNNVAILGLGETGYESARFLRSRGFDVFVSEKLGDEIFCRKAQALEGEGIRVEVGRNTLSEILKADWILLSPGISPKTELYQRLVQEEKLILSEIEVTSYFSKPKRVIAITGSCGKTTFSTWVYELLRAKGERAVLCGNIGNSWIREIPNIDQETTVVLETSSFQLEGCRSFFA